MDVITIAAISAAAVLGVGLTIAIVNYRRLAGAVDDSLQRIGTPRDGRWWRRPPDLSASIDQLERSIGRSQRERAQLAGAIQAARIGILATDDRGVITFSNEAATKFMGARQGQEVAEGRVREAIEEAILDRRPVKKEIELYTPDRRVLKLAALPLEYGVESLGSVAYIVDVTEEVRVDAVRRDFIANVSHELKTPLGALAVLAETLSGNLNDPDVSVRLADRLGVEARRLSKLVEDILDLSQTEALGVAFERVPVDDLLTEVGQHMHMKAKERGVELVVETEAGDLAVVGDRRQLRTMLVNLVDNAIKYSEPDSDGATPEVAVRGARDDGTVTIEVTDEGIGIPESHHDRIFERFYRVDRARSRSTGGTGLGLSIVRHVALNHGGEVSVVSTVGKGSKFTVRLPMWNGS